MPSAADAVRVAQRGLDGATVFPDIVLHAVPHFDDPQRPGQWYLDNLEMDALHAESLGSSDVRVAVIDSGIEWQHVDLIDRATAPFDAFSADDDPSPDPGEYCPTGATGVCDSHGTAVSGVILATADNGEGMVGMCPECTLIPIKMLGEGSGSLSADVAAFEHAIAEDAWVINNSWGFTSRVPVPAPLAAVVERATTEPRDGLGAVVVFAAGNDNREVGDEELQALPGVLCVSAVDNYGYPTSYTNFGGPVDVSAPSATVSITPSGEPTVDFGGTSAAAPVVAGLAAWALSQAPDLTAAEVSALIIDTARESPFVTHDDSGHHDTYGYGTVDPPALFAALDGPSDSGTPPTDDASEAGAGDGPADDKGGCSTVAAGRSVAGLWTVIGLVIAGRRSPSRRRAR